MNSIINPSVLPSTFFAVAALAVFSFPSQPVSAQEGAEVEVTVGGAPMSSAKSIVENAVNSKDHTILVAALKTAELVVPLQGLGPFTVFAPTNKAFSALPMGTVEQLMIPENREGLSNLLKYHVISGTLDAKSIVEAIRTNGGVAEYKTLQGGILTFKMNGPLNIVISDNQGNTARISTYDVFQSNGVIHVIDEVLLP